MTKELTDTIMAFYRECNKEQLGMERQLEWNEGDRHVIVAYHTTLPHASLNNKLVISIAEPSNKSHYKEIIQFTEYGGQDDNFSGTYGSISIKNDQFKKNQVSLDHASPFAQYYQRMYDGVKEDVVKKIEELKK